MATIKLCSDNAEFMQSLPEQSQQGQALFDWIDQHSNGWLRRVRQTPQAMALTIDMATGGLRHLPWELLHDKQAISVRRSASQPFAKRILIHGHGHQKALLGME